jgi:hypothetical protein
MLGRDNNIEISTPVTVILDIKLPTIVPAAGATVTPVTAGGAAG